MVLINVHQVWLCSGYVLLANIMQIGELVDGPEDSITGKVLNGVTYDHVFDVDIGDGEPTRKLPYNNGQNPYDVADRWLLNENLPLVYRQQVVDFITQNTGQRLPQLDSTFVDPYTGANAYVPRQQQSQKPSSVSSSKEDKASSLKHIPKKGMLVFDTAQFDGIGKKIIEFNASLQVEEPTTAVLKENDVARLKAIILVLKDTSHYHASSFADADFNLLTAILCSWPIQCLFPVLDLLRMMLLHPQAARWYSQEAEKGRGHLQNHF
ncbi:hypothetical protein O6H91_Y126500 [Diphasiastrum complanatum]|nr:hypothetical protein O6H91_Y126500 [Diphasiastrum complanatum]